MEIMRFNEDGTQVQELKILNTRRFSLRLKLDQRTDRGFAGQLV